MVPDHSDISIDPPAVCTAIALSPPSFHTFRCCQLSAIFLLWVLTLASCYQPGKHSTYRTEAPYYTSFG